MIPLCGSLEFLLKTAGNFSLDLKHLISIRKHAILSIYGDDRMSHFKRFMGIFLTCSLNFGAIFCVFLQSCPQNLPVELSSCSANSKPALSRNRGEDRYSVSCFAHECSVSFDHRTVFTSISFEVALSGMLLVELELTRASFKCSKIGNRWTSPIAQFHPDVFVCSGNFFCVNFTYWKLQSI